MEPRQMCCNRTIKFYKHHDYLVHLYEKTVYIWVSYGYEVYENRGIETLEALNKHPKPEKSLAASGLWFETPEECEKVAERAVLRAMAEKSEEKSW